jgi:hypothetical protein
MVQYNAWLLCNRPYHKILCKSKESNEKEVKVMKQMTGWHVQSRGLSWSIKIDSSQILMRAWPNKIF